jgi:hypothetical protein
MTEHLLTGLDGQNPLGFLAAVGLLRVLDDDAQRRGVALPTLAYPDGDVVPVVRTDLELDAIVALVLADARDQGDNPALQFAYGEDGTRALPGDSSAIRDLKPRPAAARELLLDCASQPSRVAGLAAAFFSELVQDRTKGNTKPTAFHFTAGQQSFLAMVDDLRTGILDVDVREALLGPWRNTSTMPSLTWDSSVSRYYALRANNPSGEKRGSVAAANWLGVVSLEAFPVVPVGDSLETTAIQGRWKTSVFRWPTWTSHASFRCVTSLLRVDAGCWTASERKALGIAQVYGARIQRSDQGGYGSFLPSDVELPVLGDDRL